MYVCSYYVHTHTCIHLSAGYRLDAIGSRHAAKQKQMTGFFVVVSSPLALCLLIRGCTGCVVGCLCYSLVGASVSRWAAVL